MKLTSSCGVLFFAVFSNASIYKMENNLVANYLCKNVYEKYKKCLKKKHELLKKKCSLVKIASESQSMNKSISLFS